MEPQQFESHMLRIRDYLDSEGFKVVDVSSTFHGQTLTTKYANPTTHDLAIVMVVFVANKPARIHFLVEAEFCTLPASTTSSETSISTFRTENLSSSKSLPTEQDGCRPQSTTRAALPAKLSKVPARIS